MSSDDQQKAPLSAEHARLAEGSAAPAGGDWKLIGPYLAERAWGSVREDYSADGDAWRYAPASRADRRNPIPDGPRGKGERSMNAHEPPIVTEDNKTAVRGGCTGNNVRYVLIGSVALAIIAWLLVEYFVRP